MPYTISYHFQMNQNAHILTWLLLAMIATANTEDQPTQLALQDTILVEQQPDQVYVYQLPIFSNTTDDLFLTVQYPLRDPLQQPQVNISLVSGSEVLYSHSCYRASNEFTGICRVPGQQLVDGSEGEIRVQCQVKCSLSITASLSKVIEVSIKDTLLLRTSQKEGRPDEFALMVPQNMTYTQVAIYAKVRNFNQAEESLQMVANVGDQDRQMPSLEKHDYEGHSIFWGGKGIFLTSDELQPGQWVKLYLYLSAGMEVELSSTFISGEQFVMELNQGYFDFSKANDSKVYALDLRDQTRVIANKSVGISFLTYSGSPVVRVATNKDFDNQLVSRHTGGSVVYLVTPQLREDPAYTGVIYVWVSSDESADYYFSSYTKASNYMGIFPNIYYYSHLQPKNVQNYFFDDVHYTGQPSMRNYSLKVEVLEGQVVVGVRRCEAGEKQGGGSVSGCIITSFPQLTDDVLAQLQNITMTVTRDDVFNYFVFSYEATQCSAFTAGQSKGHYCAFQFVFTNPQVQQAQYTVQLHKRMYRAVLKEGVLTRDLVYEDETLFYEFTQSSMAGVVSVTVYATVLEGDIYLYGSGSDPFPDFGDNDTQLVYSRANKLTFTPDDFEGGNSVFIAVYAYDLSSFTLGVVVRRKNSQVSNDSSTGQNQTKESMTTLLLPQGVSQQFTLDSGSSMAAFLLKPKTNDIIIITIQQVTGVVTLRLSTPIGQDLACSSLTNSASTITCDYEPTPNTDILAVVQANRGAVQKFSISWKKQQACTSYGLNMPYYVAIKGGEKTCIGFTVTQAKDLHLVTTLPVELHVGGLIKLWYCAEKLCSLPASETNFRIPESVLNSWCKWEEGKTHNSCRIKIFFNASELSSPVGFNFVLEEQSRDMALFDGVPARVQNAQISHQQGKYFYYEVLDYSPIKVFLNSDTWFSYYLAFHFVEQSVFNSNTTSIYLPYNQNPTSDDTWKNNLYEAYSFGTGTSVFSIPEDVVHKYCKKCYLTIALYPTFNLDDALFFSMQATQSQRVLEVGKSVIGYLEPNQIYDYRLPLNLHKEMMITIQDNKKESSLQKKCFKATLVDPAKYTLPVTQQVITLSENQTYTDLLIQAGQKLCSYQVTVTALNSPVLRIEANKIYPLNNIHNNEVIAVHQHKTQKSFKVVQIIKSASIKVYMTPIVNTTLGQIVQKPVSSFPIKIDNNQGQFIVSNTSQHFCGVCAYAIIITSDTKIDAEIWIGDAQSSVELSVSGVIKDKLSLSGTKQQNYAFYAISTFNVTINLIYGQIRVTITDPSLKVVFNQTHSRSGDIVVPHNAQTAGFSSSYKSSYTQYNITITAITNASYTIKASQKNITARLFEAVPSMFYFLQASPMVLEFINTNTTRSRENINVMVDMMGDGAFEPHDISLTISVEVMRKEGRQLSKIQHSVTRSEDTFNIEMGSESATYYLTLTSNQNTYGYVTLAKASLVHLKPTTSMVLFQEHIFEMYCSAQAVMIEVFDCWGEIEVDASKRLKDFTEVASSYDQVVLEQHNYAGHFVISSKEISGEYFVRVAPKRENSDISYLIRHHFYDKEDQLPYKMVHLSTPEVTYAPHPNGTIFTVNKVTHSFPNTIAFDTTVQYRLYLNASKKEVSAYANCRQGHAATFSPNQNLLETVSFDVTLSQISQSIGTSAIYFVTVEATVLIEPVDLTYPTQMKLIYDTIELSSAHPPITQHISQISAKYIILWLLLPFGIAGLLLYCALKYCIKKYQGLVPNTQLVQEQVGDSQHKFNKEGNGRPSDASQSLGDYV